MNSEKNRMNRNISLTQSPIFPALMGLALPIMASSFFSTAYNITDMLWIGRLGASAVAGAGTGGMFLWFAAGVSVLSRMGGQVHAAQSYGRGEVERARFYETAAMLMAGGTGTVLGIIFCVFAPALTGLFGIADQETVRLAVLYLRITGGLIVFSFLNNVLTGLFTARGDSRTPLAANTTGLAVNMLLDPILVLGPGPFPKLGVAGAAIATVTAQIISTLVFVCCMAKTESIPAQAVPARYYRDIFRVGLPSAMRSTLYCFFSMVLTRLTAGYGAGAIAVSRLGGQIESITWNTADGFGAAMNSFTGQNFGAGKYDRIRRGYRISFAAVVIWGLIITAAFVLVPRPISELFFFEEPVILICMRYLTVVGLSEAFMSVELLAEGAISGFGETRISSTISIVLTGSRIPAAILLSRAGLGLNSIWWALAATSMAKGIALHCAFYLVCRKKQLGSIHPSRRTVES